MRRGRSSRAVPRPSRPSSTLAVSIRRRWRSTGQSVGRTMATKDDLIALLAACEAAQQAKVPWWQIGRAAARLGSGTALLAEPWEPIDRWEHEVAFALAHHLDADAQTRWREQLERWEAADPGLRFMTILDEDYPANLRIVFNPPPFLVMRGALIAEDARGVAVVGTRHPSPEGLRRGRRLRPELRDP